MNLQIAKSHLGRIDGARRLGLSALVFFGTLPLAICRGAEGHAVTMTYSSSNLFDGSISRVTGQVTLGGTLAIPRGELQSIQLISANRLTEAFDQVTWNGQPFESGHQAEGQFRFLEYQTNGLQLATCRAFPGDASGDCRFNVTDLVQVLQFGQYEDGIEQNSDWPQGDWNGDREFTASDLVLALETGLYEQNRGAASVPAVPEPSGILLVVSAFLAAGRRWPSSTGHSICRVSP